MSAILYVARKSLKNFILDLLHHPTQLISYIVIALFILSGVISTGSTDTISTDLANDFNNGEMFSLDIGFLYAAYFTLLLIIGTPLILVGLQSGTTLFSMSDVNFLFVSPISSKKMLIYGIAKRVGATLLFFVIFLIYGNIATSIFNISSLDGFILIFMLAIFIFFCQLISLVLYCLSCGKDFLTKILKAIVFIVTAIYPVSLAAYVYFNGFSLENMVRFFNLPDSNYIPFFGWYKALTFGIINQNIFDIAIFGVLTLICIVLLILYFTKSNSDYYEDVLQNTESTYEMRQAIKKEGPFSQKKNYNFNKKIKVNSTGLNAGNGASAFFFKHLREIRRRSRIPFLDMFTVMIAILVPVICYFMNFSVTLEEDAMPTSFVIAFALGFSVYLQFIFIQMGDWKQELLKPYIFLVPESPFKKLIFASSSALVKSVIEGTLAFGITGIILNLNVFYILACILFYVSFGFIFTAVNIFSYRFIGDIDNKMASMLIYSVILMVSCLPGILCSVALIVLRFAFDIYFSIYVIILPIIIWNLIAMVLIYLINKKTLHNMEANY